MASISFISAAKLSDLLRTADPQRAMFVRVLSATRLALGTDPLQPTKVIDLSNEAVGPLVASDARPAPAPAPAPEPDGPIVLSSNRASRRSGEYWFELKGNKTTCGSLKELLAEGLKALELTAPGTLATVARLRGRSRRIVARDPSELFDKPHLVKDYAERLTNGWYYGTNNSGRETNVWLQRAAECAGLSWGDDFRTSLDS